MRAAIFVGGALCAPHRRRRIGLFVAGAGGLISRPMMGALALGSTVTTTRAVLAQDLLDPSPKDLRRRAVIAFEIAAQVAGIARKHVVVEEARGQAGERFHAPKQVGLDLVSARAPSRRAWAAGRAACPALRR